MTANLSYLPFHADADNGDPLVGGLVYTYAIGTSTPQTTWSDLAKATPNANPVVLNSRGEASIFFDTSLKIVVKTSAGATVQTIDNIAEGALLADTEIMALASVTSAANMLPYFTGSGTAATTGLTAFARTMLDDADAATVIATIGAATSGHTHASTYQPLDAELTSLAGLTSATDSMPYFTGSGTASTTGLTAFARTMLDDADAATVIATIGAATSGHTHASTYQPLDAALTALASLTFTAGNIIYATGVDTFAVLAPGTAGYKLESGGTGAPTWGATGSGDMLLGATQTVTEAKKFEANTLLLRGTSTGDQYFNTEWVGAGSAGLMFPNYAGRPVVAPGSHAQLDSIGENFLFFATRNTDGLSELILHNGVSNSATPYGMAYFPSSVLGIFGSTNGSVHIGPYNNGGSFTGQYRFPVNSSAAAKETGTEWAVWSDARVKDGIVDADLERCYEIVKQIRLRRFRLKEDWCRNPENTDMGQVGWIADEVEMYLPKAVLKERRESKSGEVIDDCRSLDADQLNKMLYGAVQMLMAKVEALEAKCLTG